jgi:tRNA nucleotidyltransferase (CCA-adding enzyme)
VSAPVDLAFTTAALRETTLEIVERVDRAGGRALLVGGCMRDAVRGLPIRDVDIEVFGLAPAVLEDTLTPEIPLANVGRSFEVLKHRSLPIDIAVPRTQGQWDADVDPREAAARRDFTLNAIASDLRTGEVIDPFGGLDDLAAGVLRHTSERFDEDPLRVLRGMQLVARFELEAAPETVERCRGLRDAPLPHERVGEEWRKLLLLGVRPSLGLEFLRACGWLARTPELEALVGCPQDPEWHPEGDVWVHTLHALDAFAKRRVGDPREDFIVGLAVLCHDLGKPETTQERDGRITSRGHEQTGVAHARTFLARLTAETDLVDEVCALVDSHLAPMLLHRAQAGSAAIRRLARKVGRIDRLVRVAHADMAGRPPLPADPFPAGEWLLARATELRVEHAPPPRIVEGRHLIELGFEPGSHFGPILDACYDAQIEGRFEDLEGGLRFARHQARVKPSRER